MKSSEKAEKTVSGRVLRPGRRPHRPGPCRRGGAAIMLVSAPARQGEAATSGRRIAAQKIALETQNTLRKPMDGTGTSPVTVLNACGRTSGR